MAILKSIVDVNNGNTGWTKSDVLDALETVFANLGWNNGTAATGVPVVVKAPGFTGTQFTESEEPWVNGGNTHDDAWEHCGGSYPTQNQYKDRYFVVNNNGTSAYRVLEEFRISGTAVDNAAETIPNIRHGISTVSYTHLRAHET